MRKFDWTDLSRAGGADAAPKRKPSLMPVTAWHAWLDEPTLADAILERIVHGPHKMALKGESMGKLAKAV